MTSFIRFEITPLSHPNLSVWNLPEAPDFIQLECQSESQALGLLLRLPLNGLAVVGSRVPPTEARIFTHRVLNQLRETPLVIVSGLAEGIDTEAHLAALHSNLPTLAVLGSGLNHSNREAQRKLREQIIAGGGAILSEFSENKPALKHQFLFRNRLIAGLTSATWSCKHENDPER